MNKNRLNKFIDNCNKSPNSTRIACLYFDYLSDTSLQLIFIKGRMYIKYKIDSDTYKSETFYDISFDTVKERISDFSYKLFSEGIETNILELIESALENPEKNKLSLISESERQESISAIETGTSNILDHIIKLIRYRDRRNAWHHIDDINSWLSEKADAVQKSKTKFNAEEVKKFLYTNQIQTISKTIKGRIKSLDSPDQYGNLSKLNWERDIESLLDDIYTTISEIIVSGEYPKIEKILSKYNCMQEFDKPEFNKKRRRK